METQELELPTEPLSPRVLALWEIASVLVSCLIGEWFILSIFATTRWMVIVPASLAMALMVFSHRAYEEDLGQLGFRVDNFLAATRLLILPTVAAVILTLVVAWLMPSTHFVRAPLRLRFLTVPLWALFQQYALQGYINRRAQIAFGKGLTSIVLVALLFGLVHLPNPILSGMSFIAALVWGSVYQRQPNLFALALSHAIASLAVALAIPHEIINSLRVGFKYFG